jgi:D-lactate dehydrogenase
LAGGATAWLTAVFVALTPNPKLTPPQEGGRVVTVEPGLIGGEVNRLLASYAKKHGLADKFKIGPDPSSIDSCMMGGIVANNSSGMCCGVAQNTFHTLRDLRVVLVDGTLLDTADAASVAAFKVSHAPLLRGLSDLARRVQADPALVQLIKRKFAIKCTTGYSINALLLSPDDPIEIVKRVMIGSEGTLGFVSRATINTVPDYEHKASAFIMYDHVQDACRGAAVLRRGTKVDAVEMFDRASLRECESNERLVGLVPGLKEVGDFGSALLIECRGKDKADLAKNISEVEACLAQAGLKSPHPREAYPFHHDPQAYNVFWDVRKGLIPIVGGGRETGTSMLIEDVAVPVEKLGAMTMDLIEMFQRHGYKDASCFGHALEGNLHLVFSQGFRNTAEVERYDAMMQELCSLVAEKHGGSLKAEHGTGRNVAPFVEMEWGPQAYALMWELKELFDPNYVLNPGVILNADPDIHKKSLKPSPPASPIVDRCIECGFCESNCPSRDVTLTPRQRITVWREISRLRALPARSAEQESRLQAFTASFDYLGTSTCAADGMCQQKCPVGINTGELVKSLRAEELKDAKVAGAAAMALARNFSSTVTAGRGVLATLDVMHGVVGPKPLQWISSKLNALTGRAVPVWNPYMPAAAARLPTPVPPSLSAAAATDAPRKVVYVPSCVTRMMGPSRGDSEQASVTETTLSVLQKAGYEVIYPQGVSSLCCGMMFNSRGLKEPAQLKAAEMEAAIVAASDGGKLPVLLDTSPCLATLKEALAAPALRLSLYEPVEFVANFLVDKLEWTPSRDKIALHVPCSSKKMGLEGAFTKLAGLCAKEVQPSGVPCCGMAGDRGMRYPELTAGSLQHLQAGGCSDGYSTSRTCEMSLSNHSGVNFRSVMYLVDASTKAKSRNATAKN